MTEQFKPNHEKRLVDEDLINMSIDMCSEAMRSIPDATARMIASQIHEGQTSALYAFSSTGAITERLMNELERDYNRADMNDQFEIRTWVVALMHYVECRGEDVEEQEGWSKLWLGVGPDELGNCCAACNAHFSEPHDLDCPLNPEFEEYGDE